MKPEDIDFLKELQNEMLTQDTVSQANPRFWVVQGTVREWGYDDGYSDGCSMVLDCETSIDSIYEAYNYIREYESEYVFDWDEECESITVFENGEEVSNLDDIEVICDFMKTHDIGGYNDGGYPYICHYKNIDKNFENTMFLTNRECKEHIAKNNYHYPEDAHSYAMTAWRSPQVSRLYEILENTDWDGIKEMNERLAKLRISKNTIDKCIRFADILEDELENYGTYEEYKDTINFIVGYFRKHKKLFYEQ